MSKTKKIIMWVILGLALAAGILSQIWLGKDNLIESLSEKVIESQTGLNLDLSPSEETGGLIQGFERKEDK